MYANIIYYIDQSYTQIYLYFFFLLNFSPIRRETTHMRSWWRRIYSLGFRQRGSQRSNKLMVWDIKYTQVTNYQRRRTGTHTQRGKNILKNTLMYFRWLENDQMDGHNSQQTRDELYCTINQMDHLAPLQMDSTSSRNDLNARNEYWICERSEHTEREWLFFLSHIRYKCVHGKNMNRQKNAK